jgi:hypothetical protein
MTLHVISADTNLSQAIKVGRPLEDVVRAMQTYYFDTNYHGNVSAVYGTNAVPGISYTMTIMDCAFHPRIGGLWGDLVATRVATNSTKLELIVRSEFGFPRESEIARDIKQEVVRTLERIAKIAESKH